MNVNCPGGSIRFTVTSRSELEDVLEHAVRELRERAREFKDRGILVTRHSAQDFTAELHSSVPYGLTREKRNW